jgi:PAS domain S-box-containing protein
MHWQFTPYSYLLLVAAAISAALVFFAWRRRGTSGAEALTLLMAGVCVWALGYAFELSGSGLPTKIFWAKVEYLGIVTVPLAWLAFALQYTGREGLLTRRNLALLATVPLVTLLLTWTNEAHYLVWSSTGLDVSETFPALEVGHGTWFWVHWSYAYLLLLLGTVMLVSMLVRSLHLYRKQSATLLLAALVPWVGNGVYVLGLGPVPNLDLTPFAFVLSGLAIASGLFWFRLLDVVPVARDKVIEGMSDGVVVVDLHDRVVDINPAAQRLLGCPASKALGRNATELVPNLNRLFEGYRQAGEAHAEITLGKEAAQRDYELTLSPVVDRSGHRRGSLMLLHDITERKRAEEALRESELRLRTVVANAPVVLFVLDRAGVFAFSEGKGLEALGLKPGEVVGLSVFEVYLDAPHVLEDVRRALSGEAFSAVREVAGLVFETRYSPLLHENGEVEGTIGVAVDITERRRAEKERAQRAVELARSNAELEQFAYSISHDLRAPLRSIDGFSQILLEDYADEFDEEGKDYLRRVRAAAQRMGALIDDLLTLSRLTRGEIRWEKVDLSAMAMSIAEDLRNKQPTRRVEFVIADGLTANGDAGLLKVALENLLGNAWKFTSKKTYAKIEFGVVRRDDAPAYFVRDNGAGFDEAYAAKLFAPFQRLHRADEFEGNGIGLATVQRIVHRHGGKVWAEGTPERGATFYFTL